MVNTNRLYLSRYCWPEY